MLKHFLKYSRSVFCKKNLLSTRFTFLALSFVFAYSDGCKLFEKLSKSTFVDLEQYSSGTSPSHQQGLQWAFIVQMSQTQLSWRSHNKNHLKPKPRTSGGHQGPQIESRPVSSKSYYRGNYQANHHRGGGGNRQSFPRPRSNSLGYLPKHKRSLYSLRARFESQKESKSTSIGISSNQHNFEDQQHICQLHSDTLDKCLEKSGIYVCKSYAPRCFIIQKVNNYIDFQFDLMNTCQIFQFQVDPRVASTGNSSLIQSSGIQNLNGKSLKNHATIRVDEDIITWETSFDKCTFFRTLVSTDSTSPPCSKCANPWKGNNKITTTPKEIVKDTTTETKTSTGTKSSISTSTISSSSSLCTQSLNGTPYLVKKRPLIITKPSSRQVTQTSTCHQLITTARPVATTVTEKTSRRVNGLVRASSTPNLKKVGVQHQKVKKSKEQKSKWEYL